MCDPNFNLKDFQKAAWNRALNNIEGYHIHIYFEPETTDEISALSVSSQLNELFPEYIEGTYNVGTVGPHIMPNIELDISREGYGEILQWLQLNSQGLSILIHPETGDDMKDHLESSIWINKEVGYNQTFFDKLRAHIEQTPVPKHTL